MELEMLIAAVYQNV